MTTRYPLLLLLLGLLLAPAMVLAWHFPMPQSPKTAAPSKYNDSPTRLDDRRSFLVQIPTVAAAFATTCTTIMASTTPQSAFAMISSEAAKLQWTQSVSVIDQLLQNWPSGGDAIRVELGTQGTTSPLFQIEKALKVLREDSEDIVEFTELAEEFQLTLSRADSMAYSANFAGGSGKPTPPAVYIEKAKKKSNRCKKLPSPWGLSSKL